MLTVYFYDGMTQGICKAYCLDDAIKEDRDMEILLANMSFLDCVTAILLVSTALAVVPMVALTLWDSIF